ncbi:hypothetical protein [Segatella salivae]|nr:hypothetical protein [Segatella salivae]
MAVTALQTNTNHALVWFILQGQQRHFMLQNGTNRDSQPKSL